MRAYSHLRRLVMPLLLFSLISNLAVLVSPLFMMQVLDRVIPSGNVATLLLLSVLAVSALLLQALVEAVRDMSLGRVTRWAETTGTQAALQAQPEDQQNTVDNIASASRFLGGPAGIAALNLPWIPMFLVALFLLHPAFAALLVGLVTGMGGCKLLSKSLTSADEATARSLQVKGQKMLANAESFAQQSGSAVIAQNLRSRFVEMQTHKNDLLDRRQTALSAGAGATVFLRSFGQISGLGLGAYLVTIEQMSAGAMIAGSIILGKTYGGVESFLQQYPDIRDGVRTIRTMENTPDTRSSQDMQTGALSGALRADNLIIPRGGGAPPRLDRVSLTLEPGECLAIVGNSGSGKTALLQALSGVAPAPIGSVFLDESEIRGLTVRDLYASVGYLPQQAGLMSGAISDNIACFDQAQDDARIVAAAKAAGVHGLIAALPNSYATDMGTEPYLLSAGQKQRVALARAIYMAPKYLFLDEPNALLDAEGERALGQALATIKEQGTTIVMVLHRSGILGLADKVIKLDKGRAVDFGARADVLGRLGVGGRLIELPLLDSSLEDLQAWVASQFTRATDDGFSQTAQLVASEIFNLFFRQPEVGLDRAVRCSFAFLGDTQCELSMIDMTPSDLEETTRSVRAKLTETDVFLTELPLDEAAIATVDRISERFEVRSLENATQVLVSLKGGVARNPAERVMVN